jgi:Prolipoprotein diacylglyceryl transferase
MFVLDGRPAGSALAFYTIAYGAARFGFEFVRGDTDRPYTAGFSQGQWISLWLMLALIAAEFKGNMEFHAWHVVVVACVIGATPLAALHRKLDRTRRFHLFHPYHVGEIAEALRVAADQPGGGMAVACTSMGLRISTAEITTTEFTVRQYAFSFHDSGMQPKTAAMLADLVMQLRHRTSSPELLPGEQGVFHLLVLGNGDGYVKKGSHNLAAKQMHGGTFEVLAK